MSETAESETFILRGMEDIEVAWRATAVSGLGEAAFALLDGFMQIRTILATVKVDEPVTPSVSAKDKDSQIRNGVVESLRIVWETYPEDSDFRKDAFNLLAKLSIQK